MVAVSVRQAKVIVVGVKGVGGWAGGLQHIAQSLIPTPKP